MLTQGFKLLPGGQILVETMGKCIAADRLKKIHFLEIVTPTTAELAVSVRNAPLSRAKAHAVHMQVNGISLDIFVNLRDKSIVEAEEGI